jgi:LCP family protein required for cell wall assembly
MTKWVRTWIGVGIGIAVVIIVIIAWVYVQFNPEQHFKQMEYPVLAKPSKQTMNYRTHSIPDPFIYTDAPTTDQSTFNVLLLGIDARDDESSRTDVMVVAHIDPTNKTINMVSIPRDTQVHLPGIGYTKINHAHLIGQQKGGNKAGTEASMQAVSDLLGIPINYYVKTNFEGFIHFVDTIGGIEVDLPSEVRLDQPLQGRSVITLPAGKQILDGEETLDLVRERYSLSNGDFGRQSSQFMILELMLKKLTQISYLPKLPKLLSQVQQDVIDTNFNNSDLISLAWLYKNLEEEQVQYVQLPGHSEYALDPLIGLKLYYWVPDVGQIQNISEQYLSTPDGL